MTVSVLWLFLTAPWLFLQCVIEVFPDHIHLSFLQLDSQIPVLKQETLPKGVGVAKFDFHY